MAILGTATTIAFALFRASAVELRLDYFFVCLLDELDILCRFHYCTGLPNPMVVVNVDYDLLFLFLVLCSGSQRAAPQPSPVPSVSWRHHQVQYLRLLSDIISKAWE